MSISAISVIIQIFSSIETIIWLIPFSRLDDIFLFRFFDIRLSHFRITDEINFVVQFVVRIALFVLTSSIAKGRTRLLEVYCAVIETSNIALS